MEEAVAAVENAFLLLGQGRGDNKARQRPRLERSGLQVMAAALEGVGMGLKAYTISERGARFVVLLWAPDTGDLLAMIEADKLGQMRTGAATGVATRCLSRSDSSTVGIIGSGWQARSQLEAVCLVRPIRSSWVYSPNPEHRSAFAEDMSRKLGVPVEPVQDAESAVGQADIVVTVTKSEKPLFAGSLLRDGTHINAAGSNRSTAQELDISAIERMDLITVDHLPQAQIEAGDLIPAVDCGVLTWDHVVELADVVSGRVAGRTNERMLTLFESQGAALEDVAVARVIYENARKKSMGTWLPESILG